MYRSESPNFQCFYLCFKDVVQDPEVTVCEKEAEVIKKCPIPATPFSVEPGLSPDSLKTLRERFSPNTCQKLLKVRREMSLMFASKSI